MARRPSRSGQPLWETLAAATPARVSAIATRATRSRGSRDMAQVSARESETSADGAHAAGRRELDGDRRAIRAQRPVARQRRDARLTELAGDRAHGSDLALQAVDPLRPGLQPLGGGGA